MHAFGMEAVQQATYVQVLSSSLSGNRISPPMSSLQSLTVCEWALVLSFTSAAGTALSIYIHA